MTAGACRTLCGQRWSRFCRPGRGVPLGAVIDGANRNDHKLMRQTLEAIPVRRPKPTCRWSQHLCLDKGFDYDEPRALADEFGFTLHLRSRGEEAWAKHHAGARARRWVVERTHSWLNRFRSILIRWAKSRPTISLCSTSPSPSLPGVTPYRIGS